MFRPRENAKLQDLTPRKNKGLRPFFRLFGKKGAVPVFSALVENLQRQDITCVEEAEALKRLMDEEKYTQDQLVNMGT